MKKAQTILALSFIILLPCIMPGCTVYKSGYIFTTNKDTLRGRMNIDGFNLSYVQPTFIKVGPANSVKQGEVKVNLIDINYVRLKQPGSNDSFDYVPFEGTLWQVLGKKKNAAIFYHEGYYLFSTGIGIYTKWHSAYMDKMVLISAKKVISIPLIDESYINRHTIFHFLSHTPQLLQFINKRYDQHFNKNDFKDEKAMIDYILNAENGELETAMHL
jgi:hypothetical protein